LRQAQGATPQFVGVEPNLGQTRQAREIAQKLDELIEHLSPPKQITAPAALAAKRLLAWAARRSCNRNYV
jgi:hypothetical protein